uniref:DUF6824 domain-containing protein n=1 Tax=Craspedostauros australis TaxID=1486917 RepID=A0A7R9ZKZ3_9STRA
MSTTGTHQECLYSLMTFGIPYDALPINTDGEWRRTSFLKWAQRRYKKEQNIEKYKDAVELPSRSDVLLGRGKPNQAHAGNKYLHDVIASKYEQYDMSSRREKTKIATDLVQSIKDASGRFLKRDENDIWMEVDDHTAREKVCHGFRRKREVNTITMKQTAMAEAAQQQQRLRQKHEQMLASTTLLPQMTGSAASWNFMSQQAQQQVLMQRAFGSMAAGGGADMSNGGIGSGKCMQFPAMGFGSNNEVNNVQFPMQQQQQCCSFQPMPNTW